jgi:hypothetical protein
MPRGHSRPVTTLRVGLFIVRAWVEPGSSSPLRAQIRLTTDVSKAFEQDLTVTEEAVVAALQGWLSQLLADSPNLGDDPDPLPSR